MTMTDKTPVQRATESLDYNLKYHPLPTADEVVDHFDAFCLGLMNIREHVVDLGFVASIGEMSDVTAPLDALIWQIVRDVASAAACHTVGGRGEVVTAATSLVLSLTDGASHVAGVDEKRRSDRWQMREDFAKYVEEGGAATWSAWCAGYGSDYGWVGR